MAEETEREKMLRDENPFELDCRKILKGNYLGDLEVIQNLLGFSLIELSSQLQNEYADTIKKKIVILKRHATWIGGILLGRNRSCQKMDKWNTPGGIDEFCAKWLGLKDKDPDIRMEHALIRFYDDFLGVLEKTSIPGIL